jgi:ADP-ribosylglycohydrolase
VTITARRNWRNQPWLLVTQNDLNIERQQCHDEGRDLAPLDAEFAAVQGLDLSDEDNLRRAETLLDRTVELPTIADYPYREPSDLPGIQAERPASAELPACLGEAASALSEAQLLDKALGAWSGRAAGCLLGKPVEGRKRWQIRQYLEAQGRWPLDRYFSSQAPEEIRSECGIGGGSPALYEGGITCMPEDDDTNYTATGLAIVKRYGRDFTPDDVADFWLGNIPIWHVCTAERVAYKNLVDCIPPPQSASFRNVYREWIGAQIRADFFGYVNPGNPERAAEYAWRDACISHVKNGIYGEMWVAAMLAAAYVCDDVETVIRGGLGQIPVASRLTRGIEHVLAFYHSGATYDEAVHDLHHRWDETRSHDWCHTISNAEIVAIALLWGAKDFEKTICFAVMPGFDTDCNGATAGSVVGLILGAGALPGKWVGPLNDTLLTGVAGYHKVSLTQMAEETATLNAERKMQN